MEREAIVGVLTAGLKVGLAHPVSAIPRNVAECFADAILNLDRPTASQGEVERLRLALKTIAEFPVTNPVRNQDAWNMGEIARQSLSLTASREGEGA